jgi:pyrimidine-nucleoside phosphorylase
VDRPAERPGSEVVARLTAPGDAGPYVASVDARTVGRAAVQLGAGRARKEDDVDPVAGFRLHKRAGDPVAPGDLLADIHASHSEQTDHARRMLLDAFTWSSRSSAPRPVVVDRFADGGWS